MAKVTFLINGETLKLVNETAKKIGVSRSDLLLDGTAASQNRGD